MTHGLWLEAATEGDIEEVARLEGRCFTHAWTEQQFRDIVQDPRQGTLVLLRSIRAEKDRGRLVGYGCFQTVLDEAHVHNLAVHPSWRRQGHGRRLLTLMLQTAARRGAERALLEVRRSNWIAHDLYRSLGFRGAGLRRDYYREPREDALVLLHDALREFLEMSGLRR